MVLALRAAGVQPLGGSLERPAAEDGIPLAYVPGTAFLEVVECVFGIIRGAGCLHVHAKENDDGMKFKQRDADRYRKETENMRRGRKKSRLPQRCCRSRRSIA